ncbi:MAG TPA: ROK family transcriptional regulator, partial [Pyrinomonadaceae bacterium]|nr:ROK family transcriptional regulator [Pyrinomonadaceae bacterium]
MPLTKDSGVGVVDEVESAPARATFAFDSQHHARAGVMLLRLLRAAQPISRADLARRLGVNRSTVTDTFKPLIAAGLVREDALPPPNGTGRALGRPAAALSFNDMEDYFVGVSVGVRRSMVGLAGLTGEVLVEKEFETPSDPEDALELTSSIVSSLCEQVRGRRLRVVGVTVPGPTDAARRRVNYAPHLGWHNVPVADALRFDADGIACSEEAAVPVVVENDATAAALYEARLRLRRDESG